MCQPCLAKETLESDIWNHLLFSNCDYPLENPQQLLNNATHTPETDLESCQENDQSYININLASENII